jgi:hypothetical protein
MDRRAADFCPKFGRKKTSQGEALKLLTMRVEGFATTSRAIISAPPDGVGALNWMRSNKTP